MRDESKVSVDAQQRLSRPNIYIYTSSGIQLAEIPVSDIVESAEVTVVLLLFLVVWGSGERPWLD